MSNPAESLASRLYYLAPRPENVEGDQVLDQFLGFVKESGLTLYPAQEEALLEIVAGKNVILNTPTGSGKSLVATAAIFYAMALSQRSFYTCPIKALVSEKFFALCKDFGPDNVGMMTGDATVNRDAPIICCTAEILANLALREGDRANVGCVVMDEFHYYSDRERGVAWQVPMLTLPQATFLLMSATLGPTTFFEEQLTALNGKATAVVRSSTRPVPLDFSYSENPLHETIADLIKLGRYPIYLVNFTQRACAEEAQNLMSTDYSTKEEKKAIGAALEGVRFSSPYGKDVQKYLRHGIGLHHAGLLPRYRLLVEKLAQQGHLKVICGTDTLGVGVNIPIRTVLFTRLCKYDGEKTAVLSVRDFQQISGRAGRKGFDIAGSVVAQAPEHVIDNLRARAKAGDDPKKLRKLVSKKPPVKGYVAYDKSTFERLVSSSPEPLVSRFQVTHGTLLNVLDRGDGGCKAMIRLVQSSHEKPAQKRAIGRTAFQLFHSLLQAGILERVPGEGRVRVNVDLQEDFSLNHALGLYLLDTLTLLDRESPTYALDLLTLVESILENPDLILMRQVDKLKDVKMAEMKAAGVEYDERMAELEKIEYPKPHREFIYDTFNAFARKHPWLGQENIRPKSIAREMFETYQSFPEYVREYGLERAEGVLLRYLSEVYKALVQTVPLRAKDVLLEEITLYFGAIVRAVDSSLLDEWERMRAGGANGPVPDEPVEAFDERDITRDARAFTVLVRNAVFALLRCLSRRDYDAAAALLEEGEAGWTTTRLTERMAPFWAEHSTLRLDPEARSPTHMKVEQGPSVWRVEQVLLDAEDDNDWRLAVDVPLESSRREGKPLLILRELGT